MDSRQLVSVPVVSVAVVGHGLLPSARVGAS